MTVLYFLVPIALCLAALAAVAFRWAAANDQFDDLEAPAVRILNDGEETVDASGSKGDGR